MNKIYTIIIAIAALYFTGCAANKSVKKPVKYYDRANSAAEKSHNQLRKD